MTAPLHRKFIAAVTAAALLVTAFGAAPVRADNDALKTLLAIAGIAIVGKVIHDNVKAGQLAARPRTPTRQRAVTARTATAAPVYDTSPLAGIAPRPLPERVRQVNRRLLPADCLKATKTRTGRVRYFGQRCLEKNFAFANRLPQGCAVRVRGKNSARHGYDAACLRDEGYQLARN